ncbi:MAG: sulfatase [Solirubrobacterales bacterium]
MALVGPSGSSGEAGAAQGGNAQERPNIVLLESDDQTQDSMRYMPTVNRVIGEAGATFPTNVTNWPLCCPSRATLQTGQYAHNHDVLGNSPPLGGFGNLDISNTLPVWLQGAGYYTAHIGKFLNGYESSPVGVPPGWSEWHGSKTTYRFYGYQLLEDGQVNTYGSIDEDPDNPADPASYSTDVYTEKAVDLINRRAPSGTPFFLSVAYLAPHAGGPNSGRCAGTAKPAVRHAGAFATEPLPQPPDFNEADVSDKPASIAGRDPLNANQIENATRNYRCRAESLLAIDESVGRIVDALRSAGELRNTLIIYTSDNGFFHGEHRIVTGKNRVYEEAVRVPLLMRGPGVPKGVSVRDLSINADLAPTIADAADAEPGLDEDGVSLLPFAAEPQRAHGRELLIEQYSPDGEDGEPTGTEYQAVRTSRYKYVANATGEIELYDLAADPYELTNLHGRPDYAEAEAALAQRLAALRACAGASCHSRPAMRLELPQPRKRHGERRCTPAGRFLAQVENRAQSRLVRVDFSLEGKRTGSDTKAPFERTIPYGKLRGAKGKAEIEATAELVDGRRLTLHQKVRVCR